MQRERVREILAESICVDVEGCTDNMNLKYDLGADSLSLLAFGVGVAEEFGMDDSRLKYDFNTVGELLDHAYTAANS